MGKDRSKVIQRIKDRTKPENRLCILLRYGLDYYEKYNGHELVLSCLLLTTKTIIFNLRILIAFLDWTHLRFFDKISKHY